MSEQSIRALVAALEAQGLLARVARPVDPARDLAAVALKAYRERQKSVLFADAGGTRAAACLLADRARWAVALGADETTLLPFVQRALRQAVAPAVMDRAALLAAGPLALDRLPIPQASAADAVAQTAAVAIALDPATGRDCVGLVRLTLLSPQRLAILDVCPALGRLLRQARESGRAMPVALVLGADPSLILAAAVGTWREAGLSLAGSLAGAPQRVVRDETGLPLPAEAELVIVGEIGAGDARIGRLATPFGTLADETSAAVFEAKAYMARRDPVFHAMLPGDHAGALCLAAEALVAEHIRNIEGGIDFIDIRCPVAAAAQVVVVKMKARVEGQAKTALMGALSGPVNSIKLAIAVDEDVDPADLRDVFWSAASRTHAEKDVGMIDGLRAHPLDFAARAAGVGGARVGTRWFIDSTMPPLTQGTRRDDFARAIPKNLATTDLARFLPQQ